MTFLDHVDRSVMINMIKELAMNMMNGNFVSDLYLFVYRGKIIWAVMLKKIHTKFLKPYIKVQTLFLPKQQQKNHHTTQSYKATFS